MSLWYWFAGEISAGKSTLINKILEKRILQSRNLPRESNFTVCKIRNSESVQITVEHLSGQMEVIDLDGKCDSNTEEGLRMLRSKLKDLTDMTLSQESKQYRSVDIGLPIPFLKVIVLNLFTYFTEFIYIKAFKFFKSIVFLCNTLFFIIIFNSILFYWLVVYTKYTYLHFSGI